MAQLTKFAEEQREHNDMMQETVVTLRENVAVLRWKSGMYGTIGGAVSLASGLLLYLASSLFSG